MVIFIGVNDPIHILTKMGVLSSFSISKKITEDEINSMLKTARSKAKSEKEMQEMVKHKIMQEIIDATKNGTLPGIIIENVNQHLPIKNIDSLNHMITILSQKLKSKKIDKLSLCYFINCLVNSLGLDEDDFEDFHRRVREARDNDDDDDDTTDKIS